MQQEAAPSSEIPISGAPACDRLHPIIFGCSQILPSRPLFTVAYLINLFTLTFLAAKFCTHATIMPRAIFSAEPYTICHSRATQKPSVCE